MSAIRQHDQLPKETTLSLFGNVITLEQKKLSVGLSRTLRGSCSCDWPTAYLDFIFRTSFWFNQKSSSQNWLLQNIDQFEVYKSTDTINSKHVVLMYLGLAWYFLQGSSTVGEIDGTEATGLAGPRSEIVNFVPLWDDWTWRESG